MNVFTRTFIVSVGFEVLTTDTTEYGGYSFLVCVTTSLLDSTSVSLEHWYFSTRLYSITSQKLVIAFTLYIVMNWDHRAISYLVHPGNWGFSAVCCFITLSTHFTYFRANHMNKGKQQQRDRRKLREKRRSTGVVHLPSTEVGSARNFSNVMKNKESWCY